MDLQLCAKHRAPAPAEHTHHPSVNITPSELKQFEHDTGAKKFDYKSAKEFHDLELIRAADAVHKKGDPTLTTAQFHEFERSQYSVVPNPSVTIVPPSPSAPSITVVPPSTRVEKAIPVSAKDFVQPPITTRVVPQKAHRPQAGISDISPEADVGQPERPLTPITNLPGHSGKARSSSDVLKEQVSQGMQ